MARWREAMRTALREEPGKVYRACRGKTRASTAFVARADGSLTANLAEMDTLLREAWGKVFRLYATRPEPEWDEFVASFGRFVPDAQPCSCPALDGAMLATTARRMKCGAAPGQDGWRVAELRALPPPLLDKLAEALNEVERTGKWPTTVARATVALLPKGEGPEPLQQRPITITSVVYRLWAATRLRQILSWQEKWAHPSQHGFRPKHSTADALWDLGLRAETALLDGTGLTIVSLDYEKCFDRIPQGIVLALVERLGLPVNVVAAARGIYASLDRRFKLQRGYGQTFRATNGVVQGCPLSVVFLNALVAVWMRAVEGTVAGVEAIAYADDTYVCAEGNESVRMAQESLRVTEGFARATGQRVKPGKTKWCRYAPSEDEADAAPAELRLDGQELERVDSLQSLGAAVAQRQEGEGVIGGRITANLEPARRVGQLPAAQAVKAQVMEGLVLQSALYGGIVQEPEKGAMKALTAAVETGIVGPNRLKLRSVPISLSLLRKGHRVDPVAVLRYDRLQTWVAMVRKNSRLAGRIERVRVRVWTKPSCSTGPAALVSRAMHDIRWKWKGPTVVEIPTEQLIGCEGVTQLGGTTRGRHLLVDVAALNAAGMQVLGHAVREGVRRYRWRDATKKRRVHLWGVSQGIDAGVTCALLRDGKALTPYERGVLRHVMMDAQLTQTRRAARRVGELDEDEPERCPFCAAGREDTAVKETLEHMFWECEAWDDVRDGFGDVLGMPGRDRWPPCLRLCGILPTIKRQQGQRGKVGEAGCSWDCTGVTGAQLQRLQLMMVKVVMARREARLEAERRSAEEEVWQVYPWDWQPTATRGYDGCLALLRDMPGASQGWKWDRVQYVGVVHWLAGLQWGVQDEGSVEGVMMVTFVELAIDFEMVSGLQLPLWERRKRKAAAGPTKRGTEHDAEDTGSSSEESEEEESAGYRMVQRAQVLLAMCQRLVRLGEERGIEVLPAAVRKSRWLNTLGAPRVALASVPARPILGQETLKAVRGLAEAVQETREQKAACHLSLAPARRAVEHDSDGGGDRDGDGSAHGGDEAECGQGEESSAVRRQRQKLGAWMEGFELGSFLPPELERMRRAQPWVEHAETEYTGEYHARQHATAAESQVRVPEDAVLPSAVEKYCVQHRMGRCEECLAQGYTGAGYTVRSLKQCCHEHHGKGQGSGPYWVFCEKHRKTRCLECTRKGVLPEVCCRRHHGQTSLAAFFQPRQRGSVGRNAGRGAPEAPT